METDALKPGFIDKKRFFDEDRLKIMPEGYTFKVILVGFAYYYEHINESFETEISISEFSTFLKKAVFHFELHTIRNRVKHQGMLSGPLFLTKLMQLYQAGLIGMNFRGTKLTLKEPLIAFYAKYAN